VKSSATLMAGLWLLWSATLFWWPPPEPHAVKPAGVRVLDREGRLLRGYLSPDQKRRWTLALSEISPELVTAVLQHEDRRFFRHPGVDPVAVLRTAWTNLRAGRVTGGASTLTMQLARLVEPRPRSVGYKLFQMWRALQYEAIYSKEEILAYYLNLAPYGGNVEGVGAAAQVYFGKSARELSRSEAVLLAVLPQAPGRRDPVSHPDAARAARDRLARRLLERGVIEREQVLEVVSSPLGVRTRRPPFVAPHFCRWTRKRHPNRTSVVTTLDLDLQLRAQELVTARVRELRPLGVSQGAAVILDAGTAEVLAMVGSADFADDEHAGQVNGALARRSPGSTLKPFVYALAFDRGLATPLSLLEDVPLRFSDYTPDNYDERFRGVVTASRALRTSLNVPAVAMAAALEQERRGGLYEFLQDAGSVSLDRPAGHYGLSLVLGGGDLSLLELASLYGLLARQGTVRPVRDLRPVATGQQIDGPRLLSAESAWMTSHELAGVERPDPETRWRGAVGSLPVAWKTGTSYGHRDAWSIGLAGRFVVAVWLGNFDGSGSPHLVGSTAAAPLLFTLIENLPEAGTGRWHLRPAGLLARPVCALSGAIPGPHCRDTVIADFIPGVSPAGLCQVHRRIQLDSGSGLAVCSRCRIAGNWTTRIVEWWPPRVATYLNRGGLVAESLPPHNPGCSELGGGEAPIIVSPAPDAEIHLRRGVPLADQAIALRASVNASSSEVFWFVDGDLVGSTRPGGTVFLNPERGRHRLTVVDDAGRSAATEFRVRGHSSP